MSQFDMGKKIFFLYPPIDFAKKTLRKLYEEGYEIYKIHNTEKLKPLLTSFPDALLFINTDYRNEDFNLNDFINNDLKDLSLVNLKVFAFFQQSVTFSDMFQDYVSLDQNDEELFSQLKDLLKDQECHGKREYVRFGSYREILCRFPFQCENQKLEGALHDISPKAISFSCESDLEPFIDKNVSDLELSVGAYRIKVSGILSQKREFEGKPLYIARFISQEYEEVLFNFIFTSLEKKMDEFIQNL